MSRQGWELAQLSMHEVLGFIMLRFLNAVWKGLKRRRTTKDRLGREIQLKGEKGCYWAGNNSLLSMEKDRQFSHLIPCLQNIKDIQDLVNNSKSVHVKLLILLNFKMIGQDSKWHKYMFICMQMRWKIRKKCVSYLANLIIH